MKKIIQISFLIIIMLSGVLGNWSATANSSPGLETYFATPQAVEIEAGRWIKADNHAGVIYLLFTSPARVERFSMLTDTWLDPINLGETPTAFCVDATGIYLAFGNRVARHSLDGLTETTLYTASYAISHLALNGNYIYLQNNGSIISLDKNSGIWLDGETYGLNDSPITIAPAIQKAFVHVQYGLGSIQLNADGTLGAMFQRPFVTDIPPGVRNTRSFVLPGDQLVSDNTGWVYYSDTLDLVAKLVWPTDRMLPYGKDLLVMHSGAVYGYTEDLAQRGIYHPFYPAEEIFLNGDTIYAVFNGSSEIIVTRFPASLTGLNGNTQPLTGDHLAFDVKSAVSDGSDKVFMLSRKFARIFVWSNSQKHYLDSIGVDPNPQQIAYDAARNRLLVTHFDGKIGQIDLNGSGVEEPFAQLGPDPRAILVTGDYIFVCINPAPYYYEGSEDFYLLDADGVQTDVYRLYFIAYGFDWSPVHNKLFFIMGHTELDAIPINGDGTFGELDPYFYASSYVEGKRVQISPDGSQGIISNGFIFDPVSKTKFETGMTDRVFTWLGTQVYSVSSSDNNSYLHRWLPDFENPDITQKVPGLPLGLFPFGNELVLITNTPEGNLVSVWNAGLERQAGGEQYRVFLPATARGEPCKTTFVDDFSDPSSGWLVSSDNYRTLSYINGEYEIRSGNPDYFYPSVAPLCRETNYHLGVDMRYISQANGLAGLIFYVVGDYDQYIMLLIEPAQRKSWIIENDGANINTAWNQPEIIRTGTQTNRIEVWWDTSSTQPGGSTMHFVVNGEPWGNYSATWTDPQLISRVGLVSVPYSNQSTTQVRFDNFQFEVDRGSYTP